MALAGSAPCSVQAAARPRRTSRAVDDVVVHERRHVHELDRDALRDRRRARPRASRGTSGPGGAAFPRPRARRRRRRRRVPGARRRLPRAGPRPPRDTSASPGADRRAAVALIGCGRRLTPSSDADVERDDRAAEQAKRDLRRTRTARGMPRAPRRRGTGGRSPGGTCRPSRPGSTLPSSGTIRSNQSEKNGRRSPRGWVISRIASRPPSRSTRRSSRRPSSRSATLRMPNPTVAASNVASSNGKCEQVALQPGDRARLPSRALEHPLGEVEAGDDAALALGGNREIPGAAAGVEHAVAGLHDGGDRQAAPRLIEPDRHHPVHHVVHRRDPIEQAAAPRSAVATPSRRSPRAP